MKPQAHHAYSVNTSTNDAIAIATHFLEANAWEIRAINRQPQRTLLDASPRTRRHLTFALQRIQLQFTAQQEKTVVELRPHLSLTTQLLLHALYTIAASLIIPKLLFTAVSTAEGIVAIIAGIAYFTLAHFWFTDNQTKNFTQELCRQLHNETGYPLDNVSSGIAHAASAPTQFAQHLAFMITGVAIIIYEMGADLSSIEALTMCLLFLIIVDGLLHSRNRAAPQHFLPSAMAAATIIMYCSWPQATEEMRHDPTIGHSTRVRVATDITKLTGQTVTPESIQTTGATLLLMMYFFGAAVMLTETARTSASVARLQRTRLVNPC